jgi:hypothetical protein
VIYEKVKNYFTRTITDGSIDGSAIQSIRYTI